MGNCKCVFCGGFHSDLTCPLCGSVISEEMDFIDSLLAEWD